MPSKPQVVFGDVPITPRMEEHFKGLAGLADFIHPGNATADEISRSMEQACVWLARVRPVTRRDLQTMRAVKMLTAWGVGYDHIDVTAATELAIPVCINPFFTRSVAEAALTLMLAVSKRLRFHLSDIATGGDRGRKDRGTEIQGKTVGVIGFGRIGREIGEIAQRLGMRVCAYDPYVRQKDIGNEFRMMSLDELLANSDFVVLATALTEETKYLIDAEELARMRPSAYIINVGRGGLVNEAALLSSLERGEIAGAGIDVWEHEPVSPDNPLLALDNVIGTPHCLAATWESLDRLCQGIANNIRRVLNNEPPLNVVNSEVIASQSGV